MMDKLKRVKERGPRALKARLRSLIQSPRTEGHVLLLHNGRSGSTLLGDMLDQHDQIFWDGETIEKKLHKRNEKTQLGIDKLYGELNLDDGIAEIEARLNSVASNKIFGTELQDYHLDMMGTDLPSYVGRLKKLGFSKFIFLDRNYMRKIVSHIVATQKGRFHVGAATKTKVKSVKINPERIYIGHRFTTLLGALRQYRAFAECSREVCKDESFLHLNYEDDIQSDPKAAVAKICAFLDIDLHDPKVNFGKTTDVPIADVIENYDQVEKALQNSEFGADFNRAD